MNKLATSLVFGAAILFLGPSVHAAPIVLDFEGIGDNASINDFYDGGTDSQGNMGTDYGVEFSGNTLGLIDADAGGNGNFANEPSPDTIMFWLSGDSAVMNLPAGFDTGFSFFYTSSTAADINVYSEINAAGELLGTINLTAQHTDDCTGDPSGTFCNWNPIGVSFDGVARSIDFAGTANFTGYDDVTFGSASPGGETQVPLPSTLLLMGLGLGLIGLGNWRPKQVC